jgi:hypothetical protein
VRVLVVERLDGALIARALRVDRREAGALLGEALFVSFLIVGFVI